MNDSQASPTTSGSNEDAKSFKETVKKNLSEKIDEGESFFDIIRNIVKEEFEVHESNIKELIKPNVNKTNERLDNVCSEIVVLSACLEITQKNLTRNCSR